MSQNRGLSKDTFIIPGTGGSALVMAYLLAKHIESSEYKIKSGNVIDKKGKIVRTFSISGSSLSSLLLSTSKDIDDYYKNLSRLATNFSSWSKFLKYPLQINKLFLFDLPFLGSPSPLITRIQDYLKDHPVLSKPESNFVLYQRDRLFPYSSSTIFYPLSRYDVDGVVHALTSSIRARQIGILPHVSGLTISYDSVQVLPLKRGRGLSAFQEIEYYIRKEHSKINLNLGRKCVIFDPLGILSFDSQNQSFYVDKYKVQENVRYIRYQYSKKSNTNNKSESRIGKIFLPVVLPIIRGLAGQTYQKINQKNFWEHVDVVGFDEETSPFVKLSRIYNMQKLPFDI